MVTSEKLIQSFRDTMEHVESPEIKYETEYSKDNSKIYFEGFSSGAIRSQISTAFDVIVEENTTFSAARKYLKYGKTAVLNFANPIEPGGGVNRGAMAQEECLCRSSNLYSCLSAEHLLEHYYAYHARMKDSFYSDRVIYTKDVCVIKNDDELPSLLDEKDRFKVDVITCAAPYVKNFKYINRDVLRSVLVSRIINIIECAIDNEVEVLILGAWGCGAFGNPPDLVADAFCQVFLNRDLGAYRIKKIVFAIKRSREPGCPNLVAFEKAMNNLKIKDECGEITVSLANRQERNWRKKQFAILGDSISTLSGYNPNGYNVFYQGRTCSETGVLEMKDTWWGKVIDYFGGELLANNSWSGSRVTKLPEQNGLFPSGCSQERTNSLHIGTMKPDVIIVYMGTNDWGYGVHLKGKRKESLDETYFAFAYDKMLQNLKNNYPGAEIWCCTLSTTTMRSKDSFVFPHSYGGIHMEEYNRIIRKLARKYKVNLIDLYRCNTPYCTVDGSHPTAEGMDTLASMVIRKMTRRKYYQ